MTERFITQKGAITMTLGDIVKRYREKNNLSMEMFALKSNLSKGYISMLEKNKNPNTGKPIKPSFPTIKAVARAINMDINDLIYLLDDQEIQIKSADDFADMFSYRDVMPISTRRVPLLGEISCGEPMYCNEERECYVVSGTDIHADFCLKARGDSMINARIADGDIVFIKQQPQVENGEIAAIVIDSEVTLKRVYYYNDKNMICLFPENPAYKPFTYVGEQLNHIKILGKAVAFQSDIK